MYRWLGVCYPVNSKNGGLYIKVWFSSICGKPRRNRRNWLEHTNTSRHFFLFPTVKLLVLMIIMKFLPLSCFCSLHIKLNLIIPVKREKVDCEHKYLPAKLKYSSRFRGIREMIYFLNINHIANRNFFRRFARNVGADRTISITSIFFPCLI